MITAEVKIQSFYITSIYEILTGTSIKQLEDVIKDFEEEELYEECEGIKRALDLAKKCTIEELKLEYTNELTKHNE